MLSKKFPKHEKIFSENKAIANKIKTIEDRIEQKYQALDIQSSLLAINEIISDPPKPKKESQLTPELLALLSELPKESPPHSQLDIDRDHIWDMIRRHGKLYVLGFTSSRLILSLESLFSGLVISYMKIFSPAGRAQIEYTKAFSDKKDLKIIHEKIKELRNTHYAHQENEDWRHTLHYFNENENLIIDTNAPHHSPQFHVNLLDDMLKCVNTLIIFVEGDINSKWNDLVKSLTAEQRAFLLQDSAYGTALSTDANG